MSNLAINAQGLLQPDGEAARVLAIHAHPDDETLYTGGTLAEYALQGAEVVVLTCTLGEEGEVIGDTFSQLIAGPTPSGPGADQLGGYRIHELSAALAALGVGGPHFLGGAGHFRDSGMVGSPSNDHPRAFLHADEHHVAAMIACWIRRLRPHLVLIYDDGGTYGHPDHIRAHRCGALAVELAAAGPDVDDQMVRLSGVTADPKLGAVTTVRDQHPAWDTPQLHWMMQSESAVKASLDALTERLAASPHLSGASSVTGDLTIPRPEDLFITPDEDTTVVVHLSDAASERKIEALRCHATQVTVVEDTTAQPLCWALSNNIAQPLLYREEYRMVQQGVDLS